MTEDLYILTLLNAPTLGVKGTRDILAASTAVPDSVEDILEITHSVYSISTRLFSPTLEELRSAYSQGVKTLELAERSGISVLSPGHVDFPQRLKAIKSPPLVLYVRGSTACLAQPFSIAVIGTREPTEQGYTLSESLGRIVAEMRCVVVSGLARGCDTWAHRGCLSVEGQTVAILGHGLNTIYPPENYSLAEEIIEMGGCLLSEYPPNERPKPKYFVERDRLQSGLSAGVIVVETDLKGGAMHTARFCVEEKKPLACMVFPEDWNNRKMTEGNSRLISSGEAVALSSIEDATEFIVQAIAQAKAISEML